MTALTGRTPGKYIKFQIDDVDGTVRDINVSSIGGIGLVYDEVELSALQDAVKGFLTGQPNFGLDITGVFDTLVAQAASGTTAAPALSGSHTVLEPVNGLNVPLTFGIYVGIRT